MDYRLHYVHLPWWQDELRLVLFLIRYIHGLPFSLDLGVKTILLVDGVADTGWLIDFSV